MNNFQRNRIPFLGCIALFCFTALGHAEDIYVSQTALGAGGGTSLTDTKAVSFFNTSSNWSTGAGKISAGDTVHLVGTITTQLVVQGSGTSGAPITILFESGSKLSAPYWTTGGAINAFNKSYITIDGNSVGIIENTANGTVLANKQLSWGISVENGSDITIKRLTIQDIYVRTADSNDSTGSAGVGIRCINASSVSNLVIDSNTLTYGKFGVMAIMDRANNVTITNNIISRCSTMVAITKADTAATSGVLVAGNTFANGNYWDFTTGDIFHGDGLHMWTATGPFLDVTIARNNMLTDWGAHTTGAIFMEGNYSTINIHNNLIGTTAEKLAEAPINIQAVYPSGTTANIYNNTLVGAGSNNAGGMALYLQGTKWTAVNARNNIFYNFYAGIVFMTTQAIAALNFDYNNYYSISNISIRINPLTGDQSGSSWDLITWILFLGVGELHSKSVNPGFVSGSNFSLQATSPLRDAGVPLGATYSIDLINRSRGQGLGWEIGAYEYQTATAPTGAIVSISFP